MYITCKHCHVKEHISEWTIFPKQRNLVEAVCPTCKKSGMYTLTI